MKRRFKLRRVLIALALFFIVLLVMLRVFESKLIYFPMRELESAPSELGVPFENVSIPVGGETINAWYFSKKTGSPTSAERVILVSHGNAGNISHRLALAGLLIQCGANVMLFDYEGYGASTGKPGEEGTYRDAQAAWKWLHEKGYAGTNIIAYGESLGGGVATELALRETLGGLILQSTFTSIADVGADVYPWLPVRWINTIRYASLSKLPKVHVPLLIMHSQTDGMIGYQQAERNFAAANTPKTFCEIHGTHNDGPFTSRDTMQKAITTFLLSLSNSTNSDPSR